MSNTLQKLIATSFKHGKNGKGVITSEEAATRALRTQTIVCISSMQDKVFFLTDDHCFGYSVLPKHYVPGTIMFPMNVTPRPGVEDGLIDTVEKYITVFENDHRQINTIEELVELIDSKNKYLQHFDHEEHVYDEPVDSVPKKIKEKINWQPEHFPVGTVVILGDYQAVGDEFHFSSNGNARVTVIECVNNGPDNWLIRTDAWDPSIERFHSFNFDHITGIVSRGSGPVKIYKHHKSTEKMPNFKVLISNNPLNKNRFYSYDTRDIVNHLIRESGLIKNLYIHQGFYEFFYKQTFVHKTGSKWTVIIDFDKKKAKRFIRQNINRWIKPMKVVRIEERIARTLEEEEYYRDMEAEWDRDFDVRQFESDEEPAPCIYQKSAI